LPALYSQYVQYIQFEESKEAGARDPIFGKPINADQLRKVTTAHASSKHCFSWQLTMRNVSSGNGR
jgi:hypothetical protein